LIPLHCLNEFLPGSADFQLHLEISRHRNLVREEVTTDRACPPAIAALDELRESCQSWLDFVQIVFPQPVKCRGDQLLMFWIKLKGQFRQNLRFIVVFISGIPGAIEKIKCSRKLQ